MSWWNPFGTNPTSVPPVEPAELKKPLFRNPLKTRPVNEVAPLASFPHTQLTTQQAIQQGLAAAVQQRRNKFGWQQVQPPTIPSVAPVGEVQPVSHLSGGKLRRTRVRRHRHKHSCCKHSKRIHTRRNKRHHSRR